MNTKQFSSKLSSIFTFPNLLSCITLTLLLDTCIFAPLVHTQFGPFIVRFGRGLSTFTGQSNYTDNYISSFLGSSEFSHDRILLSPIVIAKLYSIQIINECEILDNLGVSKFNNIVISQTVSSSLEKAFGYIMDFKLPIGLMTKFEQMKHWEPPMDVASSFGVLYTAQKIIRISIISLSLLSLAAKIIVCGSLHHMTVVSTDIALIFSCLSLILTLSISQFKLPLRNFSSLISLLFVCSLSLAFDIIEKSMARKFKDFIEAPPDCGLSMKSMQISPSIPLSKEVKFLIPSESQDTQPLHYTQPERDEDTISLDLESPMTSENNNDRRESGYSFQNPNLVTDSDFDAILSTDSW